MQGKVPHLDALLLLGERGDRAAQPRLGLHLGQDRWVHLLLRRGAQGCLSERLQLDLPLQVFEALLCIHTQNILVMSWLFCTVVVCRNAFAKESGLPKLFQAFLQNSRQLLWTSAKVQLILSSGA